MTSTLAVAVASDAMVSAPQVHGGTLTVGECRAALVDDHVHMLLVVAADRLLGTLARGDVPDDAPATQPALTHAVLEGRTVPPDAPLGDVRVAMLAAGVRRLAVVDGRGSLLGLLCLKRHLGGFCSDTDVAARAADRQGCR